MKLINWTEDNILSILALAFISICFIWSLNSGQTKKETAEREDAPQMTAESYR